MTKGTRSANRWYDAVRWRRRAVVYGGRQRVRGEHEECNGRQRARICFQSGRLNLDFQNSILDTSNAHVMKLRVHFPSPTAARGCTWGWLGRRLDMLRMGGTPQAVTGSDTRCFLQAQKDAVEETEHEPQSRIDMALNRETRCIPAGQGKVESCLGSRETATVSCSVSSGGAGAIPGMGVSFSSSQILCRVVQS
ncbi:hypothetical protein LZ30DRAFT_247525 [Colletotrichum cereale]|nr:hypothetical protein LZ30DRAFT_247525 [Colletotrichum cereale]